MDSCWNHDYLFAFRVTQSDYRNSPPLIALSEGLYFDFWLHVSKQIVQLISSVRKGIGELNWRELAGLEKIRKFQAIKSILFLILGVSLIADLQSPPSPLIRLFIITITHFHALIIKTAFLWKPLNLKAGLPFHPLNCKIEPNVWPTWVSLLLKSDFVWIRSYDIYRPDAAWLKVRAEGCTPDIYDLSVRD